MLGLGAVEDCNKRSCVGVKMKCRETLYVEGNFTGCQNKKIFFKDFKAFSDEKAPNT
jgi:hypothetical protein